MTIICLEANPIALAGLRRQVHKILPQADIILCRSPEEVRRTAKKIGCDVLITEIDFCLRKGEGILLAQEIQEMIPRVNIIFATAGSEHEYAMQMLKLRISGLLIKPFTKEELSWELNNLRYPKEELKWIS